MLLPTEKLLMQDSFREPMLVKIPFPPWALREAEAVEDSPAADAHASQVCLVFRAANPYSPAPIGNAPKQMRSKIGAIRRAANTPGSLEGGRSMAKVTSALTMVICLATLSTASAQEMTKPMGKWERKIGKNHLTLIVEGNRLHITYAGDKAGTMHADYAMTRDGLIYGVITSIESEEDEEGDGTKSLFDEPFSFRFRIDEGALIIHDAKTHDGSPDNVWNGRFKAARPATTRDAIVPTSYTIPNGYSFPFNTPQPTNSNGSSSLSPGGGQIFNYWLGFSR
jgi:hypothetical protein